MTVLFLLFFTSSLFASEITNVPFVKQKTSFCGPAALSSVMAYYGVQYQQEEIAKSVYSEKLNGALITDLQNFAKTNGFHTILAKGIFDDLKKYIKEKKPIILLIENGFWIISFPHYLVLTGFNEKGFIAHTGYLASQLIKYNELEDKWKQMGNVYLVIFK